MTAMARTPGFTAAGLEQLSATAKRILLTERLRHGTHPAITDLDCHLRRRQHVAIPGRSRPEAGTGDVASLLLAATYDLDHHLALPARHPPGVGQQHQPGAEKPPEA